MNYRTILQNSLEKRRQVNPRYSLRSFARKLEISPSKLSEIISGKKNLSSARALIIADRLELPDTERELFLLTAGQRSVVQDDYDVRIKALLGQLQSERSQQKNAWYFGAVKALSERGLSSPEIAVALEITQLQVENAKRYLHRLRRYHPDRQDIRYESVSVIKKIEDSSYSERGTVDADFAFLTEEQTSALLKKIRNYVRLYQIKSNDSAEKNLCMVHWGTCQILKK